MVEIEEHLNFILQYLVDNKGLAIKYFHTSPSSPNIDDLRRKLDVDQDGFKELCTILEEDKYVTIILHEKGTHLPGFAGQVTSLKITIRGRYFLRQGGYVDKLKRLREQNNRLANLENVQIHHQRNMTNLTVVLAVAALIACVWYGIEIWKFFYSYFLSR